MQSQSETVLRFDFVVQLVAVTLLLFSRQTVVVIYSIFILLASIDAFNAARQGVKLRIYIVSLATQTQWSQAVVDV